eukprot:CAMPEP_0170503244 /NCGR_PEP_ID=MMETSP0208-20121228/44091_1 /TAXON_ID=197538 /ORGANISM="Strombidium inclinatum, Strain S3" /LENGTH=63 /DNA_ID=CAMNT_0010782789 /DNA_START=360 /DNA_END=547 /DNA_ORIENTATION=-
MRRFNIDGKETKKENEDKYFRVVSKFLEALTKIPDMEADDINSNIILVMRVPTGEEFEFIHTG